MPMTITQVCDEINDLQDTPLAVCAELISSRITQLNLELSDITISYLAGERSWLYFHDTVQNICKMIELYAQFLGKDRKPK